MATEKRRDDVPAPGGTGGDAARRRERRRSGVALAAVLGVVVLASAAVLQAPPVLVVGSGLLLAAVAVRRNAHRTLPSPLGVPAAVRRVVEAVETGAPGMEGAIIDRPVRTLLVLVFAAPFVDEDERVDARGDAAESR